jgi:hypothetical protein
MKDINSGIELLNKSIGQQRSQSPVTKIKGTFIFLKKFDIKCLSADPQIYTVFPARSLEKSYPTTRRFDEFGVEL